MIFEVGEDIHTIKRWNTKEYSTVKYTIIDKYETIDISNNFEPSLHIFINGHSLYYEIKFKASTDVKAYLQNIMKAEFRDQKINEILT